MRRVDIYLVFLMHVVLAYFLCSDHYSRVVCHLNPVCEFVVSGTKKNVVLYFRSLDANFLHINNISDQFVAGLMER